MKQKFKKILKIHQQIEEISDKLAIHRDNWFFHDIKHTNLKSSKSDL